MKVLIAITSCVGAEAKGFNQPARDTWLPSTDYRFFLKPGEEKHHLLDKFKLKMKYAVDRDYDYVFACFEDCYARPERFIYGYDYVGSVYTHETFGTYCQGGAGVLLSRRVCEILARSNHRLQHRDGTDPHPNDAGSDDAWTGQVLQQHGILPLHNSGFKVWLKEEGPRQNNTVITSHLSYSELPDGYRPEYMYQKHREFLGDPLWMPTTT